LKKIKKKTKNFYSVNWKYKSNINRNLVKIHFVND
jgi:hypothetical protein